MKEIPLTKGLVALVDDEDYELVCGDNWHAASAGPTNTYAARAVYPNGARGRKITEFMHRRLMNALPGQEVDHINGDGLDNRKANLRLCTQKQNKQNRRKLTKPCSSRFKGVRACSRGKPWRATILRDKQRSLGSYDSEEEAARAYNRAAKEIYGEFARLNDV